MITAIQLHTIQMTADQIKKTRADLTNEKKTQNQIFEEIKYFGFVREYKLDAHNIPDFFYDGIAIEVKIKGSKMAIYKQCERYCRFDQVKALILCTNKSMGFPEEINGKPCYYINLGKAWL